jgi:hypothetical protein
VIAPGSHLLVFLVLTVKQYHFFVVTLLWPGRRTDLLQRLVIGRPARQPGLVLCCEPATWTSMCAQGMAGATVLCLTRNSIEVLR